jgi:hypothetical protein
VGFSSPLPHMPGIFVEKIQQKFAHNEVYFVFKLGKKKTLKYS